MTDKDLNELIELFVVNCVTPLNFREVEFKQIIKNYFNEFNYEYHKIFINKLLTEGLIEQYVISTEKTLVSISYTFTKKGFEARSAGGYKKYLKNKRRNKVDVFLTKYSPIIVSVLTLLYTIYNDSNTKSENEELIKRIEVLEKQLKK